MTTDAVSVETAPQVEGKIHAAMSAIMAEVRGVAQERKCREGGNFSFRSIYDVYEMIQPLMARYGVTMSSEIVEYHRETLQTQRGGRLMWVHGRVRYSFVASDGSRTNTDVPSEAMDTSDKATGKFMSYAHKYAVMQAFCIPTEAAESDVDPDYQKHEPTYQAPADEGYGVPPEPTRVPVEDDRPAKARRPAIKFITEKQRRELVELCRQAKLDPKLVRDRLAEMNVASSAVLTVEQFGEVKAWLEDMIQPPTEAPPVEPPPDNSAYATPAQQQCLLAALRKTGGSTSDLIEHLASQGIESMKQIPAEQFAGVLAWCEKEVEQ